MKIMKDLMVQNNGFISCEDITRLLCDEFNITAEVTLVEDTGFVIKTNNFTFNEGGAGLVNVYMPYGEEMFAMFSDKGRNMTKHMGPKEEYQYYAVLAIYTAMWAHLG